MYYNILDLFVLLFVKLHIVLQTLNQSADVVALTISLPSKQWGFVSIK